MYRTSQDVVARQGNICLHRGSQLTLGSIDGDELVCRYHGWRYGPEGRCTRIPFGLAERWGRRWTDRTSKVGRLTEHPVTRVIVAASISRAPHDAALAR